MPSWHQMQAARTPLWHAEKWTVVEDRDFLSVSRWPTAEEAAAHLQGLKTNHPDIRAYILPPKGESHAQAIP